MRELLLPNLKDKANDIRKVRIVDGDKVVNLALTGEIWTVGERDNVPAAFEKIAKLVSELAEQKVSKKTEVGKTALGDLQLELPTGKEVNPKAGVHIDFLDEKGSSIMGLVLGKNRESTTVGKEASPFGGGNNERVARLVGGSDGDTAWWVNNQFYELSAKPEEWTNKSFLDVKEIRSVDVTAPNAADSWTVSRKDITSSFAFEAAAAAETFDVEKTPLSSLLANATFTDVLTKDKAKPDLMKDASKVKITTFEGFTYNLLVTKKGEGSDLKHYLSIAVSADFPKARTPEKDEKEEDKKSGKKTQNKKDTSNKREQKKDKAWKKVPPKSGDPKEKKQGDYTYHWCEHHMAWTVHKPADCCLGKKHHEEQKPAFCANSATVAAAAATAVNPHYVALLATLGALTDNE
jgi:hypothetical protein